MYKRIVLAYDGSVEGRAALREGAVIAKRCQAQVFLLSVIAEAAGTRMADGVGGGGVSRRQEHHKAVLQDGVARLKQRGFEPVAKLVIGEPAKEIGAFAEQVAADLVVVGHRQQSIVGRWWSGATGAYLIDYIHCSLLVCRNVISDEALETELPSIVQSAVKPAERIRPHADDGDRASRAPDDSRATLHDGVAGVAAATTSEAPKERSGDPAEQPSTPQGAPRSVPRRGVRWALFMLLPLALIAGAYWYVTGGQVMSTGRRLCRSRQGWRLDRRLRHRQGSRRHGEPARRGRPGPVPPR